MPVPSAPRRPCCPGSASSTATAIPTGSAMTSAMALVTTVPKMNGSAPKVFVTWFQSWPTRKPTPNLVTDGQACWIKTATTRISAAGAAQLMNAVTVRYRSVGRGGGATESAGLSTATAKVTPSRRAGDRFRRAADQVSGGGLAVEAVSDPSYGHDLERGPRRELLAQPADVNVDRLAVAGELAAPYVLQQRVARVNASREREQVRDQVELASGQLDVSSIEDHAPCGPVDAEGADRILFGDRLRLVGFRLRSAEHRVHSCQDLANREGFGDVVVGAELEPDDLVDLGVLRRDDDDRHTAALAQRAAEVEAAHAGQHQVEQDEVWSGAAGGSQTRRAVGRFLHGEPGRGEGVPQHLADALVVLHDPHVAGVGGGRGAIHPSSTTWPVSRNTMSSATLVTRSAMRSRLWATSRSVTARRAPSESVWPLPISEMSSSKTR